MVKYLSKEDYCSIKELCHSAKNLTEKWVHRGLYQTANGKTLNADVYGALNLM